MYQYYLCPDFASAHIPISYELPHLSRPVGGRTWPVQFGKAAECGHVSPTPPLQFYRRTHPSHRNFRTSTASRRAEHDRLCTVEHRVKVRPCAYLLSLSQCHIDTHTNRWRTSVSAHSGLAGQLKRLKLYATILLYIQ